MHKILFIISIYIVCLTPIQSIYSEQMTGGGYTLQGSFDVITGQGNQGVYTLNPYSDPLTAEGVSSGGSYTVYPTPYVSSVEAVQGQSISAVVAASVSYGSEVSSVPTSLQVKNDTGLDGASSENGGNNTQYGSSSSSTVSLTTGTWYGSRGEEESTSGGFGKRPFIENENDKSNLFRFSCWFWWLIILIILIRLRQNYKEYKEKHRHK